MLSCGEGGREEEEEEEEEEELHRLKEKLEVALNEPRRNQPSLEDLAQEREGPRAMPDAEESSIKNLKRKNF
ncbi:hypothetical protein OIU84_004666 [Salix udensis]|uniref:Uncharacterized protein n=1 Tax=Salix udensis TaxID=889485 RepID=A0AAD6K4I3_9ROSI|nr:hypothetical protein OIU84_004666 [Salix udensis]